MIEGLWHSEDRATWYILVIKPTRCTNSQIYFWNRNLHFSDRFSDHHQESSTVHTAIGICHTGFADCLLAGSGWYTVLDSWWWTENLPETCRVLFQKYIWEIDPSRWFYYKNISRCTIFWMSNSTEQSVTIGQ